MQCSDGGPGDEASKVDVEGSAVVVLHHHIVFRTSMLESLLYTAAMHRKEMCPGRSTSICFDEGFSGPLTCGDEYSKKDPNDLGLIPTVLLVSRMLHGNLSPLTFDFFLLTTKTTPKSQVRKETKAKKVILSLESYLIFVEEHVGDALVDGESAAGVGADEGALLDMDLEQRVVEAAKEILGVQHRGVGLVRELAVTDRASGAGEGLPLDLVEDVAEEVDVELHLLFYPLFGLEAEREAIDDALDVAGEHVVGQKPHLAALVAGSSLIRGCVTACEAKPDIHLVAGYRPGTVTIDGRSDDWAGVDGPLLPLLPALDFDEDEAYGGGKMTVKALKGNRGMRSWLCMMVETYTSCCKLLASMLILWSNDDHKCPSVALMFQVGENATYKNMGGCSHMPGSCTDKNCHGHEVDIMHFSVGKAIPGRLYGSNLVDNSKGNGNDSFGHLVDVYAWNPHCRYLDGTGPPGEFFRNRSITLSPQLEINLDPTIHYSAGFVVEDKSIGKNDWVGAWWHSSLVSHTGFIEEDSPYGKSGEQGTYLFEFSRPLRTMDRFQQDAQFTIGQTSKVAVAFWYPTDGKPWSKSQHFSASCNWLALDVAPASELSSVSPVSPRIGPSDAATSFALLLSVVSFCLTIFIGYWVSKTRPVPFTPIDSL
ncbi:hypothetical protein ZIOFF_059075 [Zingiber officinale]|uniref:Cytochrome c-552/DMSO reductase-like haem-binding domain-containing protein n=1 Tax=Zingiber officinale TaxID=94328 RepID=A0A8J5F8U9_ZINOF|nr:hypothetical protein ZIOFF_059075 [Zingiber officinale]